MVIRAIFIGKDKDMGYFKGSEYRLKIVGSSIFPISQEASPCPYNLEGFFINWQIIEVEK